MFHFTKYEGAFGRFALELLAADPKLTELKNIGVDMESAICQGFKKFHTINYPPIECETLKTGTKKSWASY